MLEYIDRMYKMVFIQLNFIKKKKLRKMIIVLKYQLNMIIFVYIFSNS